MITNVLNRLVGVQAATITTGATGQTVSWGASTTYYVRKIPVDVKTQAEYQRLGTTITHKFIFRGSLDIQIGRHRIIDGSTYYEVAVTGQKLADCTAVFTREL